MNKMKKYFLMLAVLFVAQADERDHDKQKNFE